MDESPLPFFERFRRVTGVLLAIYWIALFVGTHTPLPPEIPLGNNLDKWIHFGAYLGLMVLWLSWRAGHGFTPLTRSWALAILAGWAAFDEITQEIPVLNRTADFADWTADFMGAISGMAIFNFAVRRFFQPDPDASKHPGQSQSVTDESDADAH